MLERLFRRRPAPLTVRELGQLGGRARAEKARRPFRDKARELLREMKRPDDPRIPA